MSYEIVLSAAFKKHIKHFKKHFPSVSDDIKNVVRELQKTPTKGNVIPGAKGVRKVRVDNSDMNRGKSGAYRLLYYVIDPPTSTIHLLMLYAKNERENIPTKEVLELLKEAGLL